MRLIIKNALQKYTILNKAYSNFVPIVFRIVTKLLVKDKKKIIFSSFSGRSFNDSPKKLYDLISKDPFFESYKLIWAFEDPCRFKNLVDKCVKVDSLSYFYHMLTARVWVANVNVDRGLNIKPSGTIYINTWHGTPLKRIGNDVAGRSDFNWQDVDIVSVTGDYEEKIFKESFSLNTASTAVIKGNPRHDGVFHGSNNRDEAERLYKTSGKRVILYAPTWRGTSMKSVNELFDLERWREELSETHVFWVREHIISQIESPMHNYETNDFVFNMTSVPDVADLLPFVDVLISDYSGMFFDFSFYHRPMFCFAHDYEDYVTERGLYCDLSVLFGERFIKDSDILLGAIQLDANKSTCDFSAAFNQKYMFPPGNAGYRLVEKLKQKLMVTESGH